MNNKLEIIETPDYILAILEYKPISEPCYRFHKFEKTINHPYHSLEHGEKYTNCWLEIIAYQPKGNVPELNLPLLPEISVEDDVNLKAQYYAVSTKSPNREAHRRGYVEGHKAATKVYSEDDLIDFATFRNGGDVNKELQLWKSLKQPKTPKWFVAEMELLTRDVSDCIGMDGEPNGVPFQEYVLKTTTINGKTYLVGTYKYE